MVRVPPDQLNRLPEYDAHQTVFRFSDESSGLAGFIAIHNTNLGPAIGGSRFWHYESETEALRDALRLSRAMTYKCALADIPYGGGKAVLMAPAPHVPLPPEWAGKYAAVLNDLPEPFFTGEDIGMTEGDIRLLAEAAPGRIVGHPEIGGLPHSWAARSVFAALKEALLIRFGSESASGRRVAVKGVGNVGAELCSMLAAEGARLVIADANRDRVRSVIERYPGTEAVEPAAIAAEEADAYSPCAMGNDLDEAAAEELRCSVVCGAANNQLASPKTGEILRRRDILYVPDYVANAGGLINVADELHPGGYSRERVERKIAGIRRTVRDIVERSKETGRPESEVADELAEARFRRQRDQHTA